MLVVCNYKTYFFLHNLNFLLRGQKISLNLIWYIIKYAKKTFLQYGFAHCVVQSSVPRAVVAGTKLSQRKLWGCDCAICYRQPEPAVNCTYVLQLWHGLLYHVHGTRGHWEWAKLGPIYQQNTYLIVQSILHGWRGRLAGSLWGREDFGSKCAFLSILKQIIQSPTSLYVCITNSQFFFFQIFIFHVGSRFDNS